MILQLVPLDETPVSDHSWYYNGFLSLYTRVFSLFENDVGLGYMDSLLVERRTRDRKVVSSNPGRSGGRIFFSRVNLVC